MGCLQACGGKGKTTPSLCPGWTGWDREPQAYTAAGRLHVALLRMRCQRLWKRQHLHRMFRTVGQPLSSLLLLLVGDSLIQCPHRGACERLREEQDERGSALACSELHSKTGRQWLESMHGCLPCRAKVRKTCLSWC